MMHLLVLTLLLFILTPGWADNAMANNTNYWQCKAHDSKKNQWVAKSAYERVSSNKAFEACKKESPVPTSCKATNDSCYYFGDESAQAKHGSDKWQCTALDQRAKVWTSNPYANKDEAALEAKADCQEHSAVPDTCYINFVTCKKI